MTGCLTALPPTLIEDIVQLEFGERHRARARVTQLESSVFKFALLAAVQW